MVDNTQLPAPAGGGFKMQVNSFEQGWRMAEVISKSSLCPKAYKDNPGDCLTAMMMGAELGLNPMQSLQNIATINGKPSLYGDAVLALVMAHPDFQDISETFDEKTMTARCVLARKNRTPVERKFSKANAEKAKLWGKAGPWQDYPERMLQMRARSRAVRDLFPDALAGLSVAEEAFDMPEVQNASVIQAEDARLVAASALTSALKEKDEPPQAKTEKVAPAATESVSEPATKKPTYAEIRDQIEKCEELGELMNLIQDFTGRHYLGKKQIDELRQAANARHDKLSLPASGMKS